MILFFTFTVLPVLTAIFLSFTSFNVLEMPKFIGFDNYTRLLLNDSVFINQILILCSKKYMLLILSVKRKTAV